MFKYLFMVLLLFFVGCKNGELCICSKISGDVLNKTQFSPSSLTVIEDCVLLLIVYLMQCTQEM